MSDAAYHQGLQRAQTLLQQRRHELARQQLGQLLGQNPDDARVHALMAVAWAEDPSIGEDVRDERHLQRLRHATDHAHAAIAAEPNLAFGHFTLASVLTRRHRIDEALAAIDRSLQLDPADAQAWGLRSSIRSAQKQHDDALESAERGLQIDPENAICRSMRSMALERLGRAEEAFGAAEDYRREDPDNADAHAMVGFTHLNEGRYREAQESFREALRLDPTSEFARVGMMRAISSRSPIYRMVDKFQQTLSRLDNRLAFGLVIGFLVVSQGVDALGNAYPAVKPYTTTIVMAYIVVALSTWLVSPLMMVMLRWHPFGKHLLSRNEKRSSTFTAIPLALAYVCGILAAVSFGSLASGLIVGIYFLILAVMTVATFSVPPGMPRIAFAIASVAVAAAPFLGLMQYFGFGFLGIQIGSQMVATRHRSY